MKRRVGLVLVSLVGLVSLQVVLGRPAVAHADGGLTFTFPDGWIDLASPDAPKDLVARLSSDLRTQMQQGIYTHLVIDKTTHSEFNAIIMVTKAFPGVILATDEWLSQSASAACATAKASGASDCQVTSKQFVTLSGVQCPEMVTDLTMADGKQTRNLMATLPSPDGLVDVVCITSPESFDTDRTAFDQTLSKVGGISPSMTQSAAFAAGEAVGHLLGYSIGVGLLLLLGIFLYRRLQGRRA
jgi:hypothetical protein